MFTGHECKLKSQGNLFSGFWFSDNWVRFSSSVSYNCMNLLASALSLQIYKENSDLLLKKKKKFKKKSDFKLTCRNKRFISIKLHKKVFCF